MLEFKEKVLNAAWAISLNGGYPTAYNVCNFMNMSAWMDPNHKKIELSHVAEALKTLESDGKVKSSIYYFPVED